MARSMTTYSDGEVIFREDSAGGDTYAIVKGLVALTKNTARGPVEIEVLGDGASFGEVGVMNGGKRTLTATAIGNVRLKLLSAGTDEEKSTRSTSNSKDSPIEKSVEQPATRKRVNLVDKGWWSRLLYRDGRASSNIEVRIVPFSGEQGTEQAKRVHEALQHCAEVKVRMVNREGPFTQKNGISKNNIGICVGAARKILGDTTGDILIWGEIPPSGSVMHLHFVSSLANDEDAAGSFNGYDILPLPLELDESWTALLHGVVLAATVPCSVAKAKNINTHIESAMELGATAAQKPPREFQTVDRAALQICLAHSVAVVARRLDEHDLLSFAAETYIRALELVTADESPIIWGMAHKHLGGVQMLIAERFGDPSALSEAQKALQVAIDTLPRRRLPREWAATQNKLGQVYYKRDYADPSSDVSLLNNAISAFQCAIQVYTRVDAPERWADVMNNYAQAVQVMGQQSRDPEMLQKAVLACRNALEVHRRSSAPLLWAATQNTLGSALFLLGKQVGRIDHLEASIDAFRSALTVYAGKGGQRMSRVIVRNLEHVQTLLNSRKAIDARRVQWLDDSRKPVPAETPGAADSIENNRQWWKDNVVDSSTRLPDGEYHHPSADMDAPLSEKRLQG